MRAGFTVTLRSMQDKNVCLLAVLVPSGGGASVAHSLGGVGVVPVGVLGDAGVEGMLGLIWTLWGGWGAEMTTGLIPGFSDAGGIGRTTGLWSLYCGG